MTIEMFIIGYLLGCLVSWVVTPWLQDPELISWKDLDMDEDMTQYLENLEKLEQIINHILWPFIVIKACLFKIFQYFI